MMATGRRKDKYLTKTQVDGEETGLEFLMKHEICANFSKAEAKELATHFIAKQYDQGASVNQKGDEANKIFIVASGVLEIVPNVTSSMRNFQSGGSQADTSSFRGSFDDDPFPFSSVNSAVILAIKKGDIYGGRAFKPSVYAWEESVRVKSESVVLLEMSREKYNEGCNKKTFVFLKKIVEMDQYEHCKEKLKQVPSLRGLPEQKLKFLSQLFSISGVGARQPLCSKGDVLNDLHILISGEIVIAEKDEEDTVTEYGRILPFNEFGGMTREKDEPFYADLLTLSICTYFVIEERFFEELMEAVPIYTNRLQREKARKGVVRDMLNHMTLFRYVSPAWKMTLENAFKSVVLQPGATVKKEGEASDGRFFIITDGKVHVYKGDKKLRTLKNRDYFGESSIVSEGLKESSATLIVSSEKACKSVVLEEKDFLNLVNVVPAVQAELMLRMSGTSCAFEHFLAHPVGKELFLKFCEKEIVAEGVLFLSAVADLENLEKRRTKKSVIKAFGLNVHAVKSKKMNMLREKAQEIYDTFIIKRLINVSAQVSTELDENFKTGNYSFSTVFSRAKESIIDVLEIDKYATFKKTEAFRSFLLDIGVYPSRVG